MVKNILKIVSITGKRIIARKFIAIHPDLDSYLEILCIIGGC